MAAHVAPAFEQKLQRLYTEALTDAYRVRELVAEIGVYTLDDGRHIAAFFLPVAIAADGSASVTLGSELPPTCGCTVLDLYVRSDAGLEPLTI